MNIKATFKTTEQSIKTTFGEVQHTNNNTGDSYTKAETNLLLAGKQDKLTFDDVPKQKSSNPVTSGGVYSELEKIKDEVIPIPTTANVGQTIVVKEVDESGKPTKWETADVGGGATDEKWELLQSKDITEEDGEIDGLVIKFPEGYKECVVTLNKPESTSTNNTIIYPYVINNSGASTTFISAFWDTYEGTKAANFELRFSSMMLEENNAIKMDGFLATTNTFGKQRNMQTCGWVEGYKRWEKVRFSTKLPVGSKYRVWGLK